MMLLTEDGAMDAAVGSSRLSDFVDMKRSGF